MEELSTYPITELDNDTGCLMAIWSHERRRIHDIWQFLCCFDDRGSHRLCIGHDKWWLWEKEFMTCDLYVIRRDASIRLETASCSDTTITPPGSRVYVRRH